MGKTSKIKGSFVCECGRSVMNRLMCDDCLRALMLEKRYSHFNSLMTARSARLPYFYGECPRHIISAFTTKTNTCQICDPPRGASARAMARKAGHGTYSDSCPRHGPDARFSVNSGKCLSCFTATGVVRVRGRNARADARRVGRVSFTAQCETCGPTQFSVNSGKCLGCYTATGARRVHRVGAENPDTT